jgi:hypothetical protein
VRHSGRGGAETIEHLGDQTLEHRLAELQLGARDEARPHVGRHRAERIRLAMASRRHQHQLTAFLGMFLDEAFGELA